MSAPVKLHRIRDGLWTADTVQGMFTIEQPPEGSGWLLTYPGRRDPDDQCATLKDARRFIANALGVEVTRTPPKPAPTTDTTAPTAATEVHVIGPNLRDRDHVFHVHAAGCADVQRSRMYRSPEHDSDRTSTYHLGSKREVVEFTYCDQLAENEDDPAWSKWQSYEPDFRWFPCLGAFPEEEA